MIPTVGAFARCAFVVLAAVIGQISAVGDIHVLGGTVDVVVLAAAAIGLYAGAVAGALSGFALGLVLDLAVGQSIGASSLVLTAVGYWVGRYGETVDPGHGLTPVPVAASATAGYAVGLAVISFMLEIGADVSPLVLRGIALTVLLNSLLALPLFGLIRWTLRPVLVRDPLGRRRRRRPPRERGPIGLRGLEV